MKIKCILSALVCLVLLQLNASKSYAQVASPCDANPFCSDSSYVFPNAIAGSLPPGVALGCLGSAPAPIWYWMQIGTAGTLELTLSQQTTGGIPTDVDFAMYGPFTDLPSGCAAVLAGAPPLQCSYSGSATETLGIGLPGGWGAGASTPAAAVVGEVYLVVITNYASTYMGASSAGTISFAQTGGTGSCDCGIICGLDASNTGPVCQGEDFELKASNNDTAHVFTYIWSGPSGVVGYTPNLVLTGHQAGTFTYTLQAIYDNDTCRATTDVTIHPAPNMYLVDTNARVLCNLLNTSLNLLSPTPNTEYSWYHDGVIMPGIVGGSMTTSETGDYKVIGVTDKGCTDTSYEVSITFHHTFTDFDFTVDPACSQDTVRFHNLSDSGTYLWRFGDGAQDTATHPMHIYAQQGNYPVTLRIMDLNGCLDSVSKIVGTMHPLSASFLMSADSLCQADASPIQFTDKSIGNIKTYNWQFGDDGTSTLPSPQHLFPNAGSHRVTLVITDSLGCMDSTSKYVYVDSVPFLYLHPERFNICVGEQVTYNLDYLQGTATQVVWNFGDGAKWSAKGNPTHSFDKEGKYWVTVTADFPVCPSITATDSIIVNAYPKVDLGPDSALCLNGPAILIGNLMVNDGGLLQYKWNTGATTPSIEVREPGMYTLTVSKGDCAASESVRVHKDCYADVPNAFTPNGDGENDYFFPRNLLSRGAVGFRMSIFNRWGQKVFETENLNGRGWDGKFNGVDQPMGAYIYQIQIAFKNGKTEEYNGSVTLIR